METESVVRGNPVSSRSAGSSIGERYMKEFDYIVVGAGSAGAVIAARLSEAADVSVLLLEAGRRDTHPFMLMPIAFPKVATNPSYVWPFESEPEPGLNGRRLPAWRGK